MPPITPSSINRPIGQNNDGGLKVKLKFALAADVDVWPEAPAAPATYAEKVTYTGGFGMKSTKQFHEIEVVIEKAALRRNKEGSLASISNGNRLTFILDNIVPEYQGWFEEHKNDALVFVVEDLSGQRNMVGTKDLPAYMETDGDFDGGMAVADDKQMEINIRSVGRMAPFLDAAVEVPLTPAV